MLNDRNHRVAFTVSVVGFLTIASLTIPWSRARAQDPDPQVGSRQIIDKVFVAPRPPAPGPPAAPRKYRRVRRTQIAKAAASKPANPTKPSTPQPAIAWEDIPETADKLGVTIWRVRPAKPGEGGARLLVQGASLAPERVASDAILNVGDQVFLSIESPRVGYLYIIDREMYADGSVSDPYLIFPTKTTRGGDNQVKAGKLINVPDADDPMNTFTLTPQPSRKDQVGERLSVIITTKPLESYDSYRGETWFTPAAAMMRLNASMIQTWETRWGGRNEQFESPDTAGQVMTEGEQNAARTGEGQRLLLQTSPAPQTFYLVNSGSKDGLLVNVELRYRRP